MLHSSVAIFPNFAYRMEIVGYIASLLIGLSLGLIGGGGSIITIPVMVYLFQIDIIPATAYSLFVVGVTSTIGSVSYINQELVHYRTAFFFGLPSIIAVFLTRLFIVPTLPEVFFTFQQYEVTKRIFLLTFFAVLMIFASWRMIKPLAVSTQNESGKISFFKLGLAGVAVGFITSLVGAGGGFLIIPALVLICHLPMKNAVGTSLVIISANSLIGFVSGSSSMQIDWILLSKITMLAIAGIFIGIHLSKRIDGNKLKPIFGWFVLAMAVYIITKEIFLNT